MSDAAAAAAPAAAPAPSSDAAVTPPPTEEQHPPDAQTKASEETPPGPPAAAKRKPLVFSDSPVEETSEQRPNDPSDEQVKQRLETIGEKIKKLPAEERHKFEMRLDNMIKGAIIDFGDELERVPANGSPAAPATTNGHSNGASTNGASATKKLDLSTAKKKIDPHGFPEHFAPLESTDRIWTWGAISKSAYEFEGKPAFRSLKGLLLGRIDRPSGITIFSFEINSSLLVQVPTGAFVVAQKGEIVICHASDSLRVQLKEIYDYQRAQTEQGGTVTRHCHVQVRPTGTWELCHGLEEITFEVQSEPDESGRPKLFDRTIERAA